MTVSDRVIDADALWFCCTIRWRNELHLAPFRNCP